MAQIKFTADIMAAAFPLLTDWAGRSVLNSQLPEGNSPIKTPQILYCQNVFPTAQGYKSVTFRDLIAAAAPSNLTFSKILTVSDSSQNKALIGITTDSKIYMITSSTYIWTDVTPVGWAGGDKVSSGNAGGVYYLYLKQFGCYSVNIIGVALTPVTIIGITQSAIYGMVSAMNYIILYDATKIYWNATDGSLNFTPSLVTGAGSSVPYDIEGKIVTAAQLGNGFVIYTDTNIILSSFSNNTQYPWIFRAATNGSGITDSGQVTTSRDLEFHTAITFAGILQVTAQGCSQLVPEVLDFIAAKIYETYNFSTNSIVRTELAKNVITKLATVASRYILVSYGITTLTDVMVFDLVLKRWGKLHLDHAAAFEVEVDVSKVTLPYNEPAEIGQSYASASPSTYNSTASNFNLPPAIGEIFGFLLKDGSIKIAALDFTATAGNSVLWLGKYQATRNALLELHEIDVESIPNNNTAFDIKVLSSINGKDISSVVTPVVIDNAGESRHFGVTSEAKNHILALLGSFNLTTVEITASLGARR